MTDQDVDIFEKTHKLICDIESYQDVLFIFNRLIGDVYRHSDQSGFMLGFLLLLKCYIKAQEKSPTTDGFLLSHRMLNQLESAHAEFFKKRQRLIESIQWLDGFRYEVQFFKQSARIIDLEFLAERLSMDEATFKQGRISDNNDMLIWPDGTEIKSDYLYEKLKTAS